MWIKDHKKLVSAALIAAAVFFALWIFGKYLLPCLFPFLLAFLTAWFLEPAIRFLCTRFAIKRGFASAVCSAFLFFVATGVAAFGVSRLIYEAVGFVRDLPSLLEWAPSFLDSLEIKLDHYVSSAPDGLREYIINAVGNISAKVQELPTVLSGKALSFLSACAASAPRVIFFCVTYVVGVFFVSRNYGDIKQFLLRQIPEKAQGTARRLKADLADGLVKWLKAELTLIAITFVELTLALSLLGVRYAVLISLVIALIDALPIFGTGTVLIPWALVLLMRGDASGAIGLAVTYCVVTVMRSFLEPKLVGGKFGIQPAAALLAIYAGFKFAGIAGMILFPVALVLLKQINDKGYVKLWK